MKTNKSFTKRLRFTKTGKVISRNPGGNHFNAKQSRKKQLNRKASNTISLSKKIKSAFVPFN